MNRVSVCRGSQRGAVAVEMVLIIPALMMVLGLVVASWRLSSARTNVNQAASAGARTASLAPSGSVARARADQVARANLETLGVPCDDLSVAVDADDFSRPVGHSGSVSVRVVCRVDLADLVLPGLPGHWEVSGSATEALDTFRERRP